MFSGIVETTSAVVTVVKANPEDQLIRVNIKKPNIFSDLHTGDSICVDGICLTLEEFDPLQMQFALGPETLRITGWTPESVLNRVVNLERSVRLEDRIHGHLVTGHVDGSGVVREVCREGESLTLRIEYPGALAPLIWTKGSVAVNGVSLTLNLVTANQFSLGLIPETLKRTNLGGLRSGDRVNLEVDNMARGIVRWAQLRSEEGRA